MRFVRFFTGVTIALLGLGVYGENALLQRPEVQYFINYMVKHDQYNRSTLVSALKAAAFQPKIIESMEKPYEKKTWDVYKGLFLTPKRVESGVAFWQDNAATLARAEKEFGVPAEIIVAILGVETQYGTRQGEYRVLDALTTLAFHYPKRAPYFTNELREYFLLCRERHISPTQFIGSYAGAIGQPQFMPSSYRNFAIDFTGNGRRDLVNDNKDVIGSVANYFYRHGWSPNGFVAQQASYEKSGDITLNAKRADYSYAQLIAKGVKPQTTLAVHPQKAGLIALDTQQGAEYWLAYPNFYVITRYNSSPQYALAVYLLAQQLREQRTIAMQHSHAAAKTYV